MYLCLTDVIVNLSIPMYFNPDTRIKGANVWLIGDHGDTCAIFFMVVTITIILYMLTFDFNARRSYAIFCWSVIIVFYLYIVLAEFSYIHSYSKDTSFDLINPT